jgi:hypothetical protein
MRGDANMFSYLNWVAGLQGISPVARLLGFRMSNYANYIVGSDWPGPNEAACTIDLDATLSWIGCGEDDLRAAMPELADQGMYPLFIEGRSILYSFPVLEDRQSPSSPADHDYALTIYVISAHSHVNKIGISKYPAGRLQNLQAANPSQRLNMPWSFEGPSKVIRRVERQAHVELRSIAVGNEWFAVETGRAIEVVRTLLLKAGLKA